MAPRYEPSSLMNSPVRMARSSNTGLPLPDTPTLIVQWRRIVLAGLQGWTLESIWTGFTGYRLENAYHCKSTTTINEHEFVIYEFSNDQNDKLELRTEREAGERNVNSSAISVSSMGSLATTNLEASSSIATPPDFPCRNSSRSWLSIASMKRRIAKLSGSIGRAS